MSGIGGRAISATFHHGAVIAAIAIAGASGAGGALAADGAPAWGLLSAVNVRVTQPAACHHVDEVNAALFPWQQPVGYDFAGADAGKLNTAMSAELRAPGEVSVIRVVLLFSTREAIAFQFGADGCHVMTLDMRIEDMGALFDRAGVSAPFGSTYYQGTGRAI
jgi:hypothetical protein